MDLGAKEFSLEIFTHAPYGKTPAPPQVLIINPGEQGNYSSHSGSFFLNLTTSRQERGRNYTGYQNAKVYFFLSVGIYMCSAKKVFHNST